MAGLTRRRAEVDSAVTARIEDPPLAALLVAKSSLAAESGCPAADLAGLPLPRLPPELSDRRGHRRRQSGRQRAGRGRQLRRTPSITVEVTADDTAVHVVVVRHRTRGSAGRGDTHLRPRIHHQIRGGRGRPGDRAVPGSADLRTARRGGRTAFADGAVFTAVLPVAAAGHRVRDAPVHRATSPTTRRPEPPPCRRAGDEMSAPAKEYHRPGGR